MLANLLDLADRVLYVDKGKLLYDWSPSQLQALSTQERQQLGLRQLDLSASQALLEQKSQDRSSSQSSDLLVKDLALFPDGSRRLPFLSMACGRVLGLMGDNGRGKSTFGANPSRC